MKPAGSSKRIEGQMPRIKNTRYSADSGVAYAKMEANNAQPMHSQKNKNSQMTSNYQKSVDKAQLKDTQLEQKMNSRMAALEKKMPPVSTTTESSQNMAASSTFGKSKGSMSKKYISAISKKGKLTESNAFESKGGDKSLN